MAIVTVAIRLKESMFALSPKIAALAIIAILKLRVHILIAFLISKTNVGLRTVK